MVLLYPNNIKKEYTKVISHANRGMDLEYLLELTNNYYLEHDIAYIYKKPTPIGIVKVNYALGKIEEAYFQKPSTLDYNGIYQSYYIEFDAKVTHSKTAFPIANVSPHQITHIRHIARAQGIVFLIINIGSSYYLLLGTDFLDFIDHNSRKSIPFYYIMTRGYEIKYNYNKGLDYLAIIAKLIGDEANGKIKIN